MFINLINIGFKTSLKGEKYPDLGLTNENYLPICYYFNFRAHGGMCV